MNIKFKLFYKPILVPTLTSNDEELSEEKQVEMSLKFSQVFAQQYPTFELQFFVGSLKQAIEECSRNANRVGCL